MRSVGVRVIAGTADQILSSLSNALIVFAVARLTSVSTFGAAVLVLSIVTASLALVRGAAGTPLLLLGGERREVIRAEAAHAVAAAVSFGLLVSLIVVIVAAAMGEAPIGVAFAASVPLVLGQDVLRFTAITGGLPGAAFAADAGWTLGSLGLLVVTWVAPATLSAPAVVWGWGIACGISAVWLASRLGVIPSWRGLPAWLRRDIGSRTRYGFEAGMEQLNAITIIVVATAFIGTVAAATLRGAVTILGPIAVLISALPLVFIPETARVGQTAKETWKRLRGVAWVSSMIVLVIGFSVPLIPARLGELLLGATWTSASGVIPYLGVEYAALCWVAAVYSLYRSQADSKMLVKVRMFQSGTAIALCTLAAAWAGTVTGVAVALAVSAIIAAGALIWICSTRIVGARETVPQG